MKEASRPSLGIAVIPIVVLLVLLGLNVWFFGDDTLSGSNQIALLLAAAVAGVIALKYGYRWRDLQHGIVSSISSALPAILILLLIGALAGTWMISGIVPAMIYYGLKVLNPVIFLFAACVVCCIVSVATGSSWTTIATIGIALLGIGKALGVGEGIIAGAIISGAYFGDKISPLSDTTNLAPAMAGTDLFTHIRYMLYTTIPSISIALLLYLIIGLTAGYQAKAADVHEVMDTIDAYFNLNPLLFAVPAIVLIMIVRRVPAVPALLAGALLGGLFAVIFQPEILRQIVSEPMPFRRAAYIAVMKAMYGAVSIETSSPQVNDLLSTGGMAGMLNTIWLIICAMVFGGVLEASGILNRITESILTLVKKPAGLISSTVGTCVFFNLTASDQYLAIVVPGRMYTRAYREMGLKPEVLSRTLEDAGTVTSVLIPWNTCGATQASVLGVATATYMPFCFFNIISPFMSIFMAVMNIKIRRLDEDEMQKATGKAAQEYNQ